MEAMHVATGLPRERTQGTLQRLIMAAIAALALASALAILLALPALAIECIAFVRVRRYPIVE